MPLRQRQEIQAVLRQPGKAELIGVLPARFQAAVAQDKAPKGAFVFSVKQAEVVF
jgi:hypothetical protein